MSNLSNLEKIVFCDTPTNYEQTSQGYLLKDTETYNMANMGKFATGCLIVFLVLFFVPFFIPIAILFVGIITSVFSYLPMFPKFILLSIGGVITFEVVWILATKIVYPILAKLTGTQKNYNLGAGELILSSYPLRMAEEYSFTFSRQSEEPIISQETGTIEGYLVGLEKVSYTQGTDTRTDEDVFWRERLFQDSLVATELSRVEYVGRFQIPPNFAPSFGGKNNKIHWVIAIKLDIPNVIKSKNSMYPGFGLSNFVLIVDPEVVK